MSKIIETKAHTNRFGDPCGESRGLLSVRDPNEGTYNLKCISCRKDGLFPEIPSEVQAILSLAREQTTSPSD